MNAARLIALVAFVPAFLGAQAGPPTQSATTLDPAVVKRVVESVARTVEENYVFPDTGKLVAEHLRRRVRSGAYDAPVDAARLTDRLTKDMQATNGDLHLYASYSGRGDAASANTPRTVTRRPGDAVAPEQVLMARRMNHNIEAAQRLAGNVGYVSASELSGRTDEAYRVLDVAMAFLDRADAMIIDLRTTRGGSPRMSDYLAGYFLGESVRTLNSTSLGGGQTFERVTPRVSGNVRRDIPLFILVGPGTASGAEDFAFMMQTRGRATLVGAKTAGAGRLTAIYPVGDGFTASVSGGRTFDPKTNKEWERVGLQPDVVTPVEDALVTAHAAAIARVAASMTDSSYKNALEWTRTLVLARGKKPAVNEAALREYAGVYELREIRFDRGKLWYYRDPNRAPEELIIVDERTFGLGEATRVEFVRTGGRVTAMRIVPPIGPTATFPRRP